MKSHVYDKIIEVCEKGIDQLQHTKDHLETGILLTTTLSMIMGICGGAKSAEKTDE